MLVKSNWVSQVWGTPNALGFQLARQVLFTCDDSMSAFCGICGFGKKTKTTPGSTPKLGFPLFQALQEIDHPPKKNVNMAARLYHTCSFGK